jgi:anti-sigma regulatory factor (Ser/Thr protein kinase)
VPPGGQLRVGPYVSDWPLTSYLGPLGALPTAPRLARGFVVQVLSGWGMTEALDVFELIASELATNVVRAASAPDGSPRYDEDGRLHLMWLRLLSDQDKLMLEVWDDLPEALGSPVMKHADEDDETGRGLDMVEMLTDDWGWETVAGWTGKRVWAVLSTKKEDKDS